MAQTDSLVDVDVITAGAGDMSVSDVIDFAQTPELNFHTFFSDVYEADAGARNSACQELVRLFKTALLWSSRQDETKSSSSQSARSPSSSALTSSPSLTSIASASSFNESKASESLELLHPEDQKIVRKYRLRLVRAHLPTIMRLALECPFKDVRTHFTALWQFIDDHPAITVPAVKVDYPSYFVDGSELPSFDKELFQSIFLQTGRVSHLAQVLGWHESVLKTIFELQQFLATGGGPLPEDYRLFLSIMAASRFGCDYLILLQQRLFLLHGGNPDWLQGMDHVPAKLQALTKLNDLLALQPWMLKQQHIQELVQNHWSVAELVHAIIILSTYHALSCFVLGLGVTPEIDTQVEVELKSSAVPCSLVRPSYRKSSTADEDEKNQSSQQAVKDLGVMLSDWGKTKAKMDKQKKTAFEQFEEAAKADDASSSTDTVSKVSPPQTVSTLAPRYCGNSDVAYCDFNVKSTFYNVFRTNEYSWAEHGRALANRFVQGAGGLLDDEFNTIYNLTYSTLSGKSGVDTSPFRRGIWYYTQRLFGIFYDDYSYREVNVVLIPDTKRYVKKLACTPHLVDASDFHKCGLSLRMDEKCHIALLAMGARQQSALLHGLHAVMNHQSA